ncbi:MAG: hypothetical protein C0423_03350 [Methylibium sp.]|nr:hypothetical protein [Methylibium sp.]
MNAYHLTLRHADGSRSALQILAASSADALMSAQLALGEQLRGASVKPLLLRAPGLVGRVGRPAHAANDSRFIGALA